jgi:hypothetical protein
MLNKQYKILAIMLVMLAMSGLGMVALTSQPSVAKAAANSWNYDVQGDAGWDNTKMSTCSKFDVLKTGQGITKLVAGAPREGLYTCDFWSRVSNDNGAANGLLVAGADPGGASGKNESPYVQLSLTDNFDGATASLNVSTANAAGLYVHVRLTLPSCSELVGKGVRFKMHTDGNSSGVKLDFACVDAPPPPPPTCFDYYGNPIPCF